MTNEGMACLNQELKARIDECRADYEKSCNKSFTHFMCPILLIDEDVELCKGHIIPQALGGSAWVPQRKDVDNFYGSATESEFSAIINDRERSLVELWPDQTKHKTHKFRLEMNGDPLDYYLKGRGQPPANHSAVALFNGDDWLCDFVVKKSATEIEQQADSTIQFVVERDYRPFITASVLKAAHLSLFYLLGYQCVFSPEGQWIGHILASFFHQYRNTPRRDLEPHIVTHFRSLLNAVVPVVKSDLQGTIADKKVIAVFGATSGVFALGVIVKAGGDTFCVFLPGNSRTIDTYFSFLKERPRSIAVKVAQWVSATGETESHWMIGPGEPTRLELPPDATWSTGSSKWDDEMQAVGDG